MNQHAALRESTIDRLGITACIGWAVACVGVLGALAGMLLEWLCRGGIDLVFLALPGLLMCTCGVALALVAMIARVLVRRMTFLLERSDSR